jgi:hypothetical protein
MWLRARVLPFVLMISLLAVSAPVRAQECGDGVVDPGETCDPPDLTLDPVTHQFKCRLDCTSCGDGVVQPNDFETCDAGTDLTCGGCLTNCLERIWGTGCPCGVDDPGFADLRTEISAACECGNASSHGAFMRCARARLALVSPDRLLSVCRTKVLRCLARSVCGKHGAVTCCRTNSKGLERCVIKADAAHCTAPAGGAASLGVSENCCDACP